MPDKVTVAAITKCLLSALLALTVRNPRKIAKLLPNGPHVKLA